MAYPAQAGKAAPGGSWSPFGSGMLHTGDAEAGDGPHKDRGSKKWSRKKRILCWSVLALTLLIVIGAVVGMTICFRWAQASSVGHANPAARAPAASILLRHCFIGDEESNYG